MKGKDEIMEDTGNGKMIVITGGKVKDANVLVANHLHHKEKRRLFKTLAYILRIPICSGDHNAEIKKGEYWEVAL